MPCDHKIFRLSDWMLNFMISDVNFRISHLLMNELNILGLEATGGIQIENDEDDYSTTDAEENPTISTTSTQKLNSNLLNQQSKPVSKETDNAITKKEVPPQKNEDKKSKPTQQKKEENNASRYSSKSKLIEKLLESLNTADNLLISTVKKHNPEEPAKEKDENIKVTPKPDTNNEKKKDKTESSKQEEKTVETPSEPTTDSSFNAPDIPSPVSDNEQIPHYLSESTEEESVQSIPEVEEPKPVKTAKKTSLLQPKKPKKEPKQKNLENYSTNGKEVGREIEIYRMITRIQEFFDNKYSIPQILATIHNNAGNVTKAIDSLKKGKDIGSESDLVRTDTVKGSQNLIQNYFHV